MTSADRLRLLVITQNFPQRQLEWAGQFVLRQARFLRDEGIDSAFIVPRPWAPWPLHHFSRWKLYGPENPLLEVPDFEVRRIDFIRPPGLAFVRYEGPMMVRPVLRAARELHAIKPFDLVLGVQVNGEANSAVEVGRALGLPSAALAIGSDVMVLPDLVPGFAEIQARYFDQLDLILTVSDEIAQRIRETSPNAPSPVLVRLARDASEFHPAADREAVRSAHGIEPEDIVAVYVGRVDEAKGMREMLAALPPVLEANPRLRFMFLGDGPQQTPLIEAGERVRPGSVAAPGRIDSSEIPGYLQAADMFVFPSRSEGLPQAVLEAMNCGLPVVATDVGGTSEAVLDGVTGILVPPLDAERLVEAVDRMAGDAELRQRFGAAGLAHALSEFDPHEHTVRLAREIRSVIASKTQVGGA